MFQRVPAGSGLKDRDGHPLTVLAPGTTLKATYRVESFHKMGGMSLTYRATGPKGTVLVKEVSCADSKDVISLTQERFTLDRLDHPGIVKAHDLFEEEGYYYLVLDFIDGQGLETLVSPLPDSYLGEKVVLDWALQLCDIFEYLHNQSPPVIYRDLKPKNVIKAQDKRLVLVDFGIARVFKDSKSQDTETMGSAITASPEHYGIAQTDARSDIYTLGATVHYLLSNGRGPEEPFRFQPIRAINPQVSKRLEAVIAKSLAMDPAQRYQTVAEMRQALLNSRRDPLPIEDPLGPGAGSSPGPAPSPSSGPTSPAASSSPPVAWVLVGILGLVVLMLAMRDPGKPATSTSPSPVRTPLAVAAAGANATEAPEELETPEAEESVPPQDEKTPISEPVTIEMPEKAPEPEPEPEPEATPTPPAPRTSEARVNSPAPSYPEARPRPTQPEAAPAPPPSPPDEERGPFEAVVPEDYQLVSHQGRVLHFEAGDPERTIDLTQERGEGKGVRGMGSSREQELNDEGITAQTRIDRSGERHSWVADYRKGGVQYREMIWAWPAPPSYVHATFRAPVDGFEEHTQDLDFVKQSLASREASDVGGRPWRQGRQGRTRRSDR